MNEFYWIQSKFLPLALNLFGKKKILFRSCEVRQLGKWARIKQKIASKQQMQRGTIVNKDQCL